MRIDYSLLLSMFCWSLMPPAHAQFADSLQLTVGTTATVATQDYQPLWLVSNRWGTIADRKADLSTHVGFSNKHVWERNRHAFSNQKHNPHRQRLSRYRLADEKENGFYISYGLDLYNHQHFQDLLLEQAYLKTGYGNWELRGGRYEEIIGEVDPELSTGSLGISGNALPIPKIGIAVTNYTDVPFTKGYLQFKGQLSHGWMGKDRMVDHAYLHEKSLYIKLGKEQLSFFGGIAHFAIWGGEHSQLGTLPYSFKDFIRVVLVQGGGEDSPVSEKMNKLGNHLGITDTGMNLHLKPWKFTLYYQMPFEDESGFRLYQNPDHLAGISAKNDNQNSVISGIILELFDTRYQSGNTNGYGLDNYYNNGLYQTGWTYQDYIIGTPLFLTKARAQQYFDRNAGSAFWNVINNRIHGIHLGLSGNLTTRLQYKTLLTYTQNYGIYGLEDLFQSHRRQGYCLQELTYTHVAWKLTAALGLDAGDLTHNIGASLGIAYEPALRSGSKE